MIETQLIRSADAPLNVGWLAPHRSTSERLVDLVLAHCSRWRRFLLITSHRTVELNWLYAANDRLAT
jgi:hypothetical protein